MMTPSSAAAEWIPTPAEIRERCLMVMIDRREHETCFPSVDLVRMLRRQRTCSTCGKPMQLKGLSPDRPMMSNRSPVLICLGCACREVEAEFGKGVPLEAC